jgi:hypothetical protein
MGKFFWVGLKINNPTRIMDISRNPSKNVGIAKALRKLWILSNVHKACGVILSRLLYTHYAMRSTHTCYAILTWIKEFTYLDKKRIIQHGNCPRFEHERLKTMANTKTNLPVNGTTEIAATAFEIANYVSEIINGKQGQKLSAKSVKELRMDNENSVFVLLVNAGNVSEVWSEVYHNMGFTHEVMVPIHGKNTPVPVEGPNGAAPATLRQYASATKAFQNALETFKPEYNKDNMMTLSAMGACWKAYKEAGKSAEQKEFEAALATIKKAYSANIKAKNTETATELSRDIVTLALAYGK